MRSHIPEPTGFYKIACRPGHNGEPDRVIAFLVPQTKQTGLSFWDFLTTVERVEDSAHLCFGFDSALKSESADIAFWQAESRRAAANWAPRSECHQQRADIAGWNADLSADERVALCASEQPTP
jgi:hypothetical protein